MNLSDRISTVECPLFPVGDDGSNPVRSLQVSDLRFYPCPRPHAVRLVRAWHSRLPNVQAAPWQFAFSADHNGQTYAVALWNNPSARCISNHWLELRRLACSPEAPKNTASAFLQWMVRWFRRNHPERERCISYQDTAVHDGTIYKAAGWHKAYTSRPRIRDRSKPRIGTDRMYRANMNGTDTDASAKVRWERKL